MSAQWKAFNSEIAIHFPGLGGLKKPVVFVFPEVLVCLECGAAQFEIPERELRVLATGVPDNAAVVLGW
jgi:hypothetical protein